MPPSDPIAPLLSAIARGEKAALEQLYRDHHGHIHAFILQRVGDPATAAEVLNDVMLTIWHQAERFAGRSRALTWILGIAHHKSLDALRRQGRNGSRQHPGETRHDEDEPHDDRVCADLAQMDEAELLRYCLSRLSEAHRMVVHLAFYHDLGYAEIAEIEGCPVGTVKTRMHHAKKALKRCLSEQSE